MLAGATSALPLPALSEPPAKTVLPPTTTLSTPAKKAHVTADFGRLPLAFESNQGQTDARVRFLTHTGDSTLFLTPSEAVFSLAAPASTTPGKQSAPKKDRTAQRSAEKRRRVALRMQMMGANPKATPLAQQPLAGRVNYFLGHDARNWHAGVPTFGRVGFHQVYPGVDLVYYGNQRHLEYDFVVAPHADPKQIQLHFAGAQGLHLDAAGNLSVRVQGQELQWKKPDVYQQDAAGKHTVAAHFRLKRLPNGQANVRIALGRYDTAQPLIIDPVLLYSTYLGGSSTQGDSANSVAVDSSGNAYVTGYTNATDFPITPGAFQTVKHTGSAIFVTKLNATGTALLYSTYLGGSDSNSNIADIAVDINGNAYVTGDTNATDFPVTPGAFQPVKKGSNSNAFVTRINPTGTSLVYSTYLGGSGGERAFGIALDNNGNTYITGSTVSTDFPITPRAFQQVKHGVARSNNTFVTKLNSTGTALLYSTYLGGSYPGDNTAKGIAIDSGGNAYVTGDTSSYDFPTTPGAFQTGGRSGSTVFVTKFNATGTALFYSAFLGGRDYLSGGNAYGIAVDGSGNAYIVGDTYAIQFPTTTGAFQRVNRTFEGSNNAFMTKLNAAGSALLYSTYLGGYSSDGDSANGIAVDSSGNAYVVGYAEANDFPITSGAFQTTKHSYNSAFVTRIPTVPIFPDFNNDGKSDLLFQNQTTHQLAVWFMNGYIDTGGVLLPFAPLPGWNVVGTGDFNADGFPDIAFQNQTTGQIALWYLQGTNYAGGAVMTAVPAAGWKVVGAGDFNGDGSADLLFQNQTSNQAAVWYLKNGAFAGGATLSLAPPTGWKIVGPR
ncbi:MAG: Cell surface protein [Chthonomonadaceae bacterium]|nr:Cell surface protein [Chthonomonadaceae bacterium]